MRLINLANICSLLMLTGCQSINFFNDNRVISPPSVKKGFSYKRLVFNNSQEAWILSNGLTETWPINGNTIWFSADKGVIRFENGRFVSYSTTYPKKQWLEVINETVNWKSVVQSKKQIIRRCITDFPRHQRDECTINTLELVTKAPDNNYVGDTLQLQWIRESAKNNEIPDIWYAIPKGTSTPIYGQLHIGSNKLSWQNW